MSRRRNRSNGIIDKAPPDVKETVDQMLMTGCTYRQIVDYLADNNITLSQQSVCRYARKFAASVEMLRAAQDNIDVYKRQGTENIYLLLPGHCRLLVWEGFCLQD